MLNNLAFIRPGHARSLTWVCVQPGKSLLELRGEIFRSLVLNSAVSLTTEFPSGLRPFPSSPETYMMISHLGVVAGPKYLEGNYPTPAYLKIQFSLNACKQWEDNKGHTFRSFTFLRHLH